MSRVSLPERIQAFMLIYFGVWQSVRQMSKITYPCLSFCTLPLAWKTSYTRTISPPGTYAGGKFTNNGGIKKSDMEKDPVCGMSVDPKSAAGKSDYQGKTYYFCSAGCKKAFDSNPEKYVDSSHSAHTHHH